MKFETLLYIFFILLTIIAPLLRKKKSPPVNKPSKPPTPDGDFFKQLEKQLTEWAEENSDQTETGRKEKQEPEITQEPSVVYENYEEKLESYDNQPVEIFSYDSQYTQQETSDKLTFTEPLLSQQQTFKTLSGDSEKTHFRFDPVKAIIYSEILKRPEY